MSLFDNLPTLGFDPSGSFTTPTETPPSQQPQLADNSQTLTDAQPTGPQAALTGAATKLGVNPRDLAAVMSYETGGTFNPNLWGGKGGNYMGLIQFGPNERQQYGAQPGQTFEQQVPAVVKYFQDRGLKPGMNLAQIYSIVNAGSLDANGQPRWQASDGNGNIATHVQRIQNEHYANADKFLGGQSQPQAGTVYEQGMKMLKSQGEPTQQAAAPSDQYSQGLNMIRMAQAGPQVPGRDTLSDGDTQQPWQAPQQQKPPAQAADDKDEIAALMAMPDAAKNARNVQPDNQPYKSTAKPLRRW